MTEWMRLGATVGTLVVALACVVAAGATDQNRLYSRRGCQYAFAAAGLLLFVCIPVLVLDASGTLGSLGWLALVLLAGGGAVLTGLGRRWTIQSGRGTSVKTIGDRGGARIEALSPALAWCAGSAGDPAWLASLTTRAAAARIPVLLLTVTADGHRVELNQN